MKNPLENTEPKEGAYYRVGKEKKLREFTTDEDLVRKIAVTKGKKKIKRVKLKNGKVGYLV